MERNRGGTEWISEFLEWTFTGSDRSPAVFRAYDDSFFAIDAAEGSAAAYLEWIDVSPLSGAAAGAPFGFDRRGLESETDAHGVSREGMLLMALRAEADCVHMLRQVLDEDGAGAGQLRLAIEGLEEAQRLLEGEQQAWHALRDVRESGWTPPQGPWSAGFDREWPSALENVASEVRALAGKVLAMHPH